MSSIAGLEIDAAESVVHFEDTVELVWEDAGEDISIEVQDPDGTAVFVWNNDSDGSGGGSISVGFVDAAPGEYSVYATSTVNGSEEWADAYFELATPALSITSLEVNGSRKVNSTLEISGTVTNEGQLGSNSVLYVNASMNGNVTRVATFYRTMNASEDWTFTYYWTPTNASGYEINASVWSIRPMEFNISDNTATLTVTIREPTTSDGDGFDLGSLDDVVVIVIIVIAGIAGTFGGMFVIERSRFSLLCLFAPLYHKIGSKDLFNNEVRGMVFGYITANEGANYSKIKRELRLPNGTLAYHLKVLGRHGHVIAIRDGGLKRFYTRAAVPKGRNLKSLNRTQEGMLKRLGASPGMTQRELADSMYLTQSAISYNLKILEKKGLITGVGKKNIQYLLTPGPVDFRCTYCGMAFSAETASFCPKCGERVDAEDLGRRGRPRRGART